MAKMLTEWSAAATMITSMMGASIYFVPVAFRASGYVCGWLITLLIAALTSFSLYSIAYSARKVSTGSTYSSLSVHISPKLKHAIDVFVIVNSMTANICVYRYLSELIVDVFPALLLLSPDHETARKGVVVVLLVPFFILASYKNLSSLRYVSFSMVASIAYLIILLVIYNLLFRPGDFSAKATPHNGLSSSIPILVTAMACQSNMVKVLEEMASTSMRSIISVSVWSGVGGGLIYGLIGHLGYSLFGDSLNGDVLSVFADKGSSINIRLANTVDKYLLSSRAVVWGSILIFLGSFPMQLNPLTTTLFNMLPPSQRTDRTRTLLTVALITLCFSLVMVRNLSANLVISIAGATVTNFISFLFPFVFFVSVKRRFTPSTLLAVACMAACISSSVYMVANIATGKKDA